MSHRKSKARRRSRPVQADLLPRAEAPCAAQVDAPVTSEAEVTETRLQGAAHEPVQADSGPVMETYLSESGMEEDAAENAAARRDAEAAAIGQRLRTAREARGLDVQDAARQLRLPHRVLEKLERGDWSGIDSPLYLRGYLRSYSKLLGIDVPRIEPAAPILPITPPLVSTGGIPRSQYLLHRYTTAATYLGLTALVVVPLVVLGLHGGLKHDLTRLVPLDPPATETVELPDAGGSTLANAKTAVDKVRVAAEENMPLLASMTPMSLLDNNDSARRARTEPPVPARSPARGLDLHLEAPSWVEIHAADGSRVEYALLEAGDHHYDTDGEISVRLGNSQDAVIRIDGQVRELEPYRRANVAHFRVDADGAMQPPRG